MTTIQILKTSAWVNTQPVQPTEGGTLHVIVDINTNDGKKISLKQKIPQGFNPTILLLDFVESLTEQFVHNPQEVRYKESLESEKQYTSIELFFKDKKISDITEIEIIS